MTPTLIATATTSFHGTSIDVCPRFRHRASTARAIAASPRASGREIATSTPSAAIASIGSANDSDSGLNVASSHVP
jgi:hypothetical protein